MGGLPMVKTEEIAVERLQQRCETARDSAPVISRRLAWGLAGIGPICLLPVWMVVSDHLVSLGFLATFAGFVLVAILLVSSYTDLRSNRIPNWLTYWGLVWGLAINLGASWLPLTVGEQIQLPAAVTAAWPVGAVGLGQSLLGAVTCFAVMLLVYRLAGGGAGDVKLATVIGAFLGPALGFRAILSSYILAATLIVVWAVWQCGPLKLIGAFWRRIGSVILPLWVRAPNDDDEQLLQKKMPLALTFAMGTLAVLFWGDVV